MRHAADITAALAAWYADHARTLPWRVPPGEACAPDPYAIWLSEVMSQQTTLAAAGRYHAAFLARWPNVHALAHAEEAEVMAAWAGLGYYARARNLHACARMVSRDLPGLFPDTEAGLRALPGIGPYTAAAIAAIAFQRRAVVVDGNVERVTARLADIRTPLPAAKAEMRAVADALTPQNRPGDHAQAMMDLGATICTPRGPACVICPVRPWCGAVRAGDPQTLPVKAPKMAKPTRRGLIYAARDGAGRWLVETRPPRGLLGGMPGFPTTDWGDDPAPAPPLPGGWRAAGEVAHTFTHFHLVLTVLVHEAGGAPSRGDWRALDPASLPTVMRKVHAAAMRALDRTGAG
ncbi:MAG: A/G-specific adenine glycosylase [Paracoccaceae bacterium]